MRRPQDEPFLFGLANRLVKLRTERGLSQRRLADKAGLSRRQLVVLEAGGADVRILTLRHLAQALGVSVHLLLGAEEGEE